MTRSRVGARARLALNVMTVALSAFSAWGWGAQITEWPPSFAHAGYVVLAVLNLATQQLANAAAARGQRALRSGQFVSAAVGIVLAITFATVTARGVEHAWARTTELARLEAAAPLEREIVALEEELAASRRALRALPSDIPGSRLLILQAPIEAALQDAQSRLDAVRTERAHALAPRDEDREAQFVFFLVGFGEPAFYWLLAAGEQSAPLASRLGPMSQSSDVPPRVPSRRHGVPSARGAGTRVARLLRGALTALAAYMPGAATPPALLRADVEQTDVMPVEPPNAHPATRARNFVPVRRPALRPGGGTPVWLDEARALRDAGLSYRAIGRRLGVPKSTIGRWLKPPPSSVA